MGVSPVVGIIGVACPLLGDPHTAGHPDSSVGDQQAPVRAVDQAPHCVGLRRPTVDHADTRILQGADELSLHLRGAERVEDHPALDALLGLRGDRACDRLRDVAPPIDVGLDVERALR
jgi:hypothetical protein